jgi:hypothetical protein
MEKTGSTSTAGLVCMLIAVFSAAGMHANRLKVVDFKALFVPTRLMLLHAD